MSLNLSLIQAQNRLTLQMAAQLSNQNVNQNVEFISIRGYVSKSSGKVANVTLLNGYTYGAYLADCAKKLENLPFQDLPMEVEARQTLMARYTGNPEGKNQSEAQQKAYVTLFGNFRLHKETGIIHFAGVKHTEKTLVDGTYPTVNSRPKTITQRNLEKLAGVKNWRTFRLTSDQFQSAAFRGKELLTVDM